MSTLTVDSVNVHLSWSAINSWLWKQPNHKILKCCFYIIIIVKTKNDNLYLCCVNNETFFKLIMRNEKLF